MRYPSAFVGMVNGMGLGSHLKTKNIVSSLDCATDCMCKKVLMMSQTNHTPCPICSEPSSQPSGSADYGRKTFHDCPRCGKFSLRGKDDIQLYLNGDPIKRAIVSHRIRRSQISREEPPIFSETDVENILNNNSLPSFSEQSDNLLRLIGDHTPPGEPLGNQFTNIQGIVGTTSDEALIYCLESLAGRGLVDFVQKSSASVPNSMLTFRGWEQYEAIQRGSHSGFKAFMAMKFGDKILDGMINNHFRQALTQVGFKLFRLDDEPKGGLIDNRLRVEIKACRFMLADLTHDNNGAYWEAGYAEGLGKPVIYLCEKSKFTDYKTHFDTNHQHTVLWATDEPEKSCADLKATVRATIPEAKQSDSQN